MSVNGRAPLAPERLDAVMAAEERYTVLANDLGTVSGFVENHSRILTEVS